MAVGVFAQARADDGASGRESARALDLAALATAPVNPTFPMYRTREDVLFWVQYFYKHPEADLLKLAADSLLKARMRSEDGWVMTGLLAGIIQTRPESLSHFAVRDIYDVLQEFRQVLLVGLWLGGANGRAHLQQLGDEVADEAGKQTIARLLATPPPDPLHTSLDVVNANMNLHVLLGMFYATGNIEVVDRLIDLCRDWSVDVLAKGGREGAARFYVAKNAREKLALLCQEHDVARSACRRALAQSEAGDARPRLTKEQQAMVRGILDVVERLEADTQAAAEHQKQQIDASVERALHQHQKERANLK